jgi:predicted deacylase
MEEADMAPIRIWLAAGAGLLVAFGGSAAGPDQAPFTVGTATANSGYLDATASTRGEPTITGEAGRAGTVDPADVSTLVEGSLSVMRLLQMLPGAPATVEHPVWIESVKVVASEQTGIFYPLVAGGTYVARGMIVGYVTDYVGRKTFDARAPEAGIVLYICAVPSMKQGDTIVNIGVVASSPPQ